VRAGSAFRAQGGASYGVHDSRYSPLARSLSRNEPENENVDLGFIVVWGGCAIFTVGDEFHQSFVVSRTASAQDVLIDICGAFSGLALYLTVNRGKWTRPFATATELRENP